MVELGDAELFESDEYGRQRSIVFAIVVATGFLSVFAGAFTIPSENGTVVGAVLVAVGVAVLTVAVAIALGSTDELLFE